MRHGFFLIDKQSGPSSAKAINPIKRIEGIEKVGHAGTLDPLASGLLVVGVNRATRLLGFIQSGKKIYSGTFFLGKETDTYDIQGQVTAEYSEAIDAAAVVVRAQDFLGIQQQLPPVYSALKIKGVPSYELARRGEAVTLQPRQIEITSFQIMPLGDNTFKFTCECSTGTYVRSLIFDLGRALGSGAMLTSLRRDSSLPFHVADAVLAEAVKLDALIPWYEALPYPRIEFSAEQINDLAGGRQDFLVADTEKIHKLAGSNGLLLYTDTGGLPAGVLRKKLDTCHYELLLHVDCL